MTMDKLLFYVFYKTQYCKVKDNFSVQFVKAWSKESAIDEFYNLLADKSYIKFTKVCNQIEYDTILKNNVLISE